MVLRWKKRKFLAVKEMSRIKSGPRSVCSHRRVPRSASQLALSQPATTYLVRAAALIRSISDSKGCRCVEHALWIGLEAAATCVYSALRRVYIREKGELGVDRWAIVCGRPLCSLRPSRRLIYRPPSNAQRDAGEALLMPRPDVASAEFGSKLA